MKTVFLDEIVHLFRETMQNKTKIFLIKTLFVKI